MLPPVGQWYRALVRAIERNQAIQSTRCATLATCDDDGFPAARTVVIRSHQDGILQIYTDARSQKVSQLRDNPKFPITNEQFRIRGALEQVTDDVAVAKCWQALSDHQRKQYVCAAPGKPLQESSIPAYAPQAPDADVPSQNFVVCRLIPARVDHLMLPLALQADKPKRFQETAIREPKRFHSVLVGGQWQSTAICP